MSNIFELSTGLNAAGVTIGSYKDIISMPRNTYEYYLNRINIHISKMQEEENKNKGNIIEELE